MSRNAQHAEIDTPTRRGRLAVRPEPYWRQISPGLFLGYRKSARVTSWVVRHRVGNRYVETRIGTPDDSALKADGEAVLTYAQAHARCCNQPQLGETLTLGSKRAPGYARHAGSGPTFDQCVRSYLDHRTAMPGGPRNQIMTPQARRVSEGSWELHAGRLGPRTVMGTTADDLRRWHAAIAKSTPLRRRKGAPFDLNDEGHYRARQSTANRMLTIVKAALNHAWRSDELPRNCRDYWRSVQKFRLGDDSPPRMLAAGETLRLLNASDPPMRELLTAALMTGARAGELRRLTVGAYSHETVTIRIHQTKTGKTLTQPLTREGQEFFDRVTAGRKPEETMLLDENGRAWTKHSYKRPFNAARAAAGLDDVKFKATRATYGKLLLLATRDIEVVAKALGHSDTKTTRAHYAAILPSEVARGVALMEPLGIAQDRKVIRLS